jgi:hypothetical protein
VFAGTSTTEVGTGGKQVRLALTDGANEFGIMEFGNNTDVNKWGYVSFARIRVFRDAPVAFRMTYADGAGTTWNYLQTFQAAVIDGKPTADGTLDLSADIGGIPIADTIMGFSGTSDFRFDGVYDPVAGTVKGTYVIDSAWSASDAKASMTGGIHWPGDVTGKVKGDKIVLTFIGTQIITGSSTAGGVTTVAPEAKLSLPYQILFNIEQ